MYLWKEGVEFKIFQYKNATQSDVQFLPVNVVAWLLCQQREQFHVTQRECIDQCGEFLEVVFFQAFVQRHLRQTDILEPVKDTGSQDKLGRFRWCRPSTALFRFGQTGTGTGMLRVFRWTGIKSRTGIGMVQKVPVNRNRNIGKEIA